MMFDLIAGSARGFGTSRRSLRNGHFGARRSAKYLLERFGSCSTPTAEVVEKGYVPR
jgi:hypothetical protein